MKNNKINVAALLFAVTLAMSSCKKENTTNPSGNNTGTSTADLYTHFKTPSWEKTVPCEELVFYADAAATDSTFLAGGTSSSAKFKILLSVPRDSSKLATTATNGKYGIYLAGSDDNMYDSTSVMVSSPPPFYLAFTVPIDESHLQQSSTYLRSIPTENRAYYNQVTQIKYVKSESNHAIFLVRGNFSLKANNPIDSSVAAQIITGDYSYQVGVLRK
jgi:hypothetical protein